MLLGNFFKAIIEKYCADRVTPFLSIFMFLKWLKVWEKILNCRVRKYLDFGKNQKYV